MAIWVSHGDNNRSSLYADIASALRHSRSVEEAAHNQKQVGRLIGLSTPTYIDNVLSTSPMEDEHGRRIHETFLGWSAEMMDWWYNERIGLRHPDVRRCLREHLPFPSCINGITAGILSPEERLVRNRMINLGLGSQIVIPVHLANGTTSLVGWASQDERAAAKLSEGDLLSLVGLAYTFADTMMRMKKRPRGNLFSKRELECIGMTARGFTAKQIAQQLGLQPETVRGYIKAASRRSGARSKAQLVAIAQMQAH